MSDGTGVLTSMSLLQALNDPVPTKRESAWQTFVERYRRLIFGWCRRLGQQAADADEVCAEVLAKLTEHMKSFVYDPSKSFRGWLKTLVQNVVIDFCRRRARRPGDVASGDSSVRAKLEEIEDPARIDALVGALHDHLSEDLRAVQEIVARVRERVEPHTWEAFFRTAIEGERGADVAAQLNISKAAVFVAKQRVGKMLQEEGHRWRARHEA